jgi:hypothetical protein
LDLLLLDVAPHLVEAGLLLTGATVRRRGLLWSGGCHERPCGSLIGVTGIRSLLKKEERIRQLMADVSLKQMERMKRQQAWLFEPWFPFLTGAGAAIVLIVATAAVTLALLVPHAPH